MFKLNFHAVTCGYVLRVASWKLNTHTYILWLNNIRRNNIKLMFKTTLRTGDRLKSNYK